MADIGPTEKGIVIDEDAARGALSPDEVSKGDTLMPMLVWGLGLTAVGFIIAAIVLFGRP
jgi:hypothetical protein